MAFKKANPQQAALKIGIYGAPGSGKTFTSLLLAEGLSNKTGKRVAYVDTERGTDFYAKTVKERQIHPDAFDFDAIYTKSITEVLTEVKSLNPNEHSVVIIDSITHIWEACIQAYAGKTTSAGTIPMHAWGKIKKPYKELMSFLLSTPIHVIFCGRQGVEYENSDSGELNAVGFKMKAEGETPYEPHILIRMESIKPKKGVGIAKIVAFAEKDRTGILAGKSFENPTFETLVEPLLGILGTTQATISSQDEVAAIDAEKIAEDDSIRLSKSQELFEELSAKLSLCKFNDQFDQIAIEIKESKPLMITEHVAQLRDKFADKKKSLGV